MSKKESRYYYSFISKLFKNISNNSGLTKNFKDQLNIALCLISKKVSLMAQKITIISKKKTISEGEILKAIKFMITDNLFLEEIKSYANEALEKYKNTDENGISRQSRAGIIFPVSITEKFIRNFGYNNLMITAGSSIYLACFLEILTSKIIQKCLGISDETLAVRLTIRELFLGIKRTSYISDIFDFCKINIIGGGVLPEINSFLLNKKRRKISKKQDAGQKKHRFRPGTIALREIKKYQKYSDSLIFAKLPFEKLVRKIIYEKAGSTIKISSEFFIVLQYWIENFLISFLRDSNLASIHSKRIKVIPEDLEFIRKIRNYPEVLYEAEEDVNEEKETV